MISPSPIPAPEGSKVVREDYEVRNHLGTLFATFPTKDQAKAHVQANMGIFPGLYVEHVVQFERRVKAYRPRPVLVKS